MVVVLDLVGGRCDQRDAVGVDASGEVRQPRHGQQAPNPARLGQPVLHHLGGLVHNDAELIGREGRLDVACARVVVTGSLGAPHIGELQHVGGDLSLDTGALDLVRSDPVEDRLSRVECRFHISNLGVGSDTFSLQRQAIAVRAPSGRAGHRGRRHDGNDVRGAMAAGTGVWRLTTASNSSPRSIVSCQSRVSRTGDALLGWPRSNDIL